MAYEVKDNTFSLFENDKKGNDKAPDYRGKGLFGGQEIKVAVWKRKSQSGIEYFSGVIEKNEKPAEVSTVEPQPAQEVLNDSDIPF